MVGEIFFFTKCYIRSMLVLSPNRKKTSGQCPGKIMLRKSICTYSDLPLSFSLSEQSLLTLLLICTVETEADMKPNPNYFKWWSGGIILIHVVMLHSLACHFTHPSSLDSWFYTCNILILVFLLPSLACSVMFLHVTSTMFKQ